MDWKQKLKQNMHWDDSNWIVRWLSTAGFVVLIIIFRLAKTGFDANEVFTLEWLGSILPFLFAFVFLSKLWTSAGIVIGFEDTEVKDVRETNDEHYLEINKDHRKNFDNYVHNDNYRFRAKKKLKEVTRKINVYGNKKPNIFKLHIGKKKRTKAREKYTNIKSKFKGEKEQLLSFLKYLDTGDVNILEQLQTENFDIELCLMSKKEVNPEEYFMNEGKYNNEQGRFKLKSFLFKETVGTKLITTIAVPILISFEISKSGMTGDAWSDLMIQLLFLFMGLNGAFKTGIVAITSHLFNQIKEDNVYLHTFREEVKDNETVEAINLDVSKIDLKKEEEIINKIDEKESRIMTKEEKKKVEDFCGSCIYYSVACGGLQKKDLENGLLECEDLNYKKEGE